MKHSVLVIGLGRFGTAAALELMRLGHDVLAVDQSQARVDDVAPDVTHALQADATDIEALRALGAADFEHAIVAISGDPEPSIFASMALKQLGVPNVVAKAGSALHGSILERVGADRVVYPEREMGQRVAHVFAVPEVIDYIDVATKFGIMTLQPPEGFVGRSLGELDMPRRLGLTPVAVLRGVDLTINPAADVTLEREDRLILIGLDEGLARLDQQNGPPKR